MAAATNLQNSQIAGSESNFVGLRPPAYSVFTDCIGSDVSPTQQVAPQGRPFVDVLSAALQQAPVKEAFALLETLRQECEAEAALGRTSLMTELHFRGSRWVAQEAVKHLVLAVESLGFAEVEWWNGQRWRESSGQYFLLFNKASPVAQSPGGSGDKCFVRVRVQWKKVADLAKGGLHDLSQKSLAERPRPRAGTAGGSPMLDQLRRLLETSEQVLSEKCREIEAFQTRSADAKAEAARAEEQFHAKLAALQACS
mmetsp:Transcript_770/g.1636  ORF Transcript_770/g.1636 Transcript_770/m.1636 type:complete len:255 (-) Transcript_770:210-974(-)